MGKGTPKLKSFSHRGPTGSGSSMHSLAPRRSGHLPCCGDSHTQYTADPEPAPGEGGERCPPEAGLLLGALPLRVLECLLPPDLGQGLTHLHQPGTQSRFCLGPAQPTLLGARRSPEQARQPSGTGTLAKSPSSKLPTPFLGLCRLPRLTNPHHLSSAHLSKTTDWGNKTLWLMP